MKNTASSPLSRLRRSDKIILGIIAALLVVIVILNVMDRVGLKLVNAPLMLYLPILALLALVGWGAFALIRRIKGRVTKVVVGSCVVMVTMIALLVGFTYLGLVTYTAMPHAYKTLSDPSGAHKLVVLWRFDDDVERNEQSIQARKEARLAAYPDSDTETVADDVTVAFDAYPTALGGLFYRANAGVEGEVYLAYTGNIVPMNTVAETVAATEAPAKTKALAATDAPADAEPEAVGTAAEAPAETTAEVEIIDTPHGTMMLEWLDDGTAAHFYVQDPGVAEGGECTVRFGK